MVCFPDSSPPCSNVFFLYGCYNRGLEQTPCSGLTVGFMAKGSVTLRPQVFALVSKRRASRTVHNALSNNLWVSDIQGNLTAGVISEFQYMGFDQGCDPAARSPRLSYLVVIFKGPIFSKVGLQNLFQGTSSFWLILEFGNHGLQENINSSYGW